MAWVRSEEEVDKMINEMMSKGKGKYITQSVTFKKDSKRDIELLKHVLLNSQSFGGHIKQLIAKEFDGIELNKNDNSDIKNNHNNKKDVCNFV